MRKTLIQTLLAAFCAIPFALRSLGEGWVAAAPLEGGGVMLINMRNAMLSGGKKWKNPYITDGLVAMWDGEWNAGGGVHDPNATTWADLSIYGNNALRSPNNSVPQWGSDYFKTHNNTVGFISGTNSAYYSMYENSKCACEVVAKAIDMSSNDDRALVYIGGVAQDWGYCIGIRTISASDRLGFYMRIRGGRCEAFVPQDGSKDILAYGYVSIDGSFRHAVIHALGKSNDVQETVTPSLRWTENKIGIGCGTKGGYVTNGIDNIYCVRVYNRTLTADEIAHNSAIDKARFNLPDAT